MTSQPRTPSYNIIDANPKYTPEQMRYYQIFDNLNDQFISIANSFRSALDSELEEIGLALSQIDDNLQSLDDVPENRSRRLALQKEISGLNVKKLKALEEFNNNMVALETTRSTTARIKNERYERTQEIKKKKMENMSVIVSQGTETKRNTEKNDANMIARTRNSLLKKRKLFAEDEEIEN